MHIMWHIDYPQFGQSEGSQGEAQHTQNKNLNQIMLTEAKSSLFWLSFKQKPTTENIVKSI